MDRRPPLFPVWCFNSLANTPLAEVEVHEDTHTLTCSMLSLPKTWVGGKVAQKKYLDEAKRKLAEAQNTVSDARVEAASKAVKDLKKAAREKGVGGGSKAESQGE